MLGLVLLSVDEGWISWVSLDGFDCGKEIDEGLACSTTWLGCLIGGWDGTS